MTAYSSYTDEQLVALLRDSDAAAFTELYDRYHQRVYGYLFTLIKMPESTEDLVHEVFMKLWESRTSITINSSFSAYLFRMCHNKGVDALRKIAGDRSRLQALIEHYKANAIVQFEAAATDYNEIVEQALDTLTPQRRAVYRLCKQEGKSYREAAEQLGISTHTVKEHLANAIADLRTFIQLHKGEFAVLFFLCTPPPIW
jgi:RNA polymerase sigma-70 factor (family 1)